MTPEDALKLAEQRRREVAILKSRIARLESTVKSLQATIEELQGSIQPLLKDLETLIGVMKAAAGAFKVLEFIGRIGKPITFIGSLIIAGYAAWQKFRGS